MHLVNSLFLFFAQKREAKAWIFAFPTPNRPAKFMRPGFLSHVARLTVDSVMYEQGKHSAGHTGVSDTGCCTPPLLRLDLEAEAGESRNWKGDDRRAQRSTPVAAGNDEPDEEEKGGKRRGRARPGLSAWL